MWATLPSRHGRELWDADPANGLLPDDRPGVGSVSSESFVPPHYRRTAAPSHVFTSTFGHRSAAQMA